MNAHFTPEQRTISDQRIKIEELEEEIRLLKEDFEPIPPPVFPREWQLTAQQRRVVMALYNSTGTVKREHFFRMIETKSDHPDALLKVVMVKIRKKVRPLGVEIHNEWKIGYWIDSKARAIIKAAIDAN